jgi:16S rRNA (cytidine1402-2'-O)-methyltransferase
MEKALGRLFLIPNVLAPGDPAAVLPAASIAALRELGDFIVEGEKAAWRLLAALRDRESLASVRMELLDEHSLPEALPALLEPALAGTDLGLLSEAGLPCIADPGGALVALAHERGIRVIPLVGPSSISLALMASGFDGQRFSFLGYLPTEPPARRAALQAIEGGVRADGGTRIFIETPYRNDRLLEDCLAVLAPETRLCVARGLTGPAEWIRSAPLAAWRREKPEIGKEPAVFLIGRTPGIGLDRPRRAEQNRQLPRERKR